MIGWMELATSTTRMPNTGSTRPESAPRAKAWLAFAPSLRSGSDMAAPSGKFWMPMPNASASAPA